MTNDLLLTSDSSPPSQEARPVVMDPRLYWNTRFYVVQHTRKVQDTVIADQLVNDANICPLPSARVVSISDNQQ